VAKKADIEQQSSPLKPQSLDTFLTQFSHQYNNNAVTCCRMEDNPLRSNVSTVQNGASPQNVMGVFSFTMKANHSAGKRIAGGMLLAGALCLSTSSAKASIIDLDFENINATYPSGYAFIKDYYNGGTSSDGTTGTNYGISFGDNAQAICLNTLGTLCSNTSRGGLGAPSSQKGGLFFLSGSQTYLNYAAGFDTGFSFNYVSLTESGSVGVYDGLNGTGNLLASLNLTPNAGSCIGYSAGFCPFSPSGVLFSGTAKSISFGGVENQIVFDDVTFGTNKPGPADAPGPLPLLGVAAAFGYSRKLRKQIMTGTAS
jgi:hypothetical protein